MQGGVTGTGVRESSTSLSLVRYHVLCCDCEMRKCCHVCLHAGSVKVQDAGTWQLNAQDKAPDRLIYTKDTGGKPTSADSVPDECASTPFGGGPIDTKNETKDNISFV